MTPPLMNSTDALARHHVFKDEELDFILNHDIKYRCGLDTEGDAE